MSAWRRAGAPTPAARPPTIHQRTPDPTSSAATAAGSSGAHRPYDNRDDASDGSLTPAESRTFRSVPRAGRPRGRGHDACDLREPDPDAHPAGSRSVPPGTLRRGSAEILKGFDGDLRRCARRCDRRPCIEHRAETGRLPAGGRSPVQETCSRPFDPEQRGRRGGVLRPRGRRGVPGKGPCSRCSPLRDSPGQQTTGTH